MSAHRDLPSHWLGLASDLAVGPLEIEWRRVGDCIAVHYPPRRDFHDLNALWSMATPSPADLPALLESWESEFASAGVEAKVLCWETPVEAEGDGAPWDEAESLGDLAFSRLETLRCVAPSPVERNPDFLVRKVESDEDWRRVVELNVSVHGRPGEPRAEFARWMIGVRQREACEAGRAAWWAGWRGDEAVSSAGLYEGDGAPARFQEVVTHPRHRRRGACTSLVSTMLERAGSDEFLIIASSGSDADRIYRRLGFSTATRIFELRQSLVD